MVRILLVRHGQVQWNSAGGRVERFRGRIDVPLNADGEQQAGAVARRIRQEFTVDAVYSSPLQRAWRTATAIGEEVGCPVKALAGLNDQDFGDWQGLTIDEVAERYPDLFALWRNQPHRLQIPGGETFDQVRERVVAAVEDVIARHEGQTVVLVSHRAVCRVLLCAMLGLGNDAFWRIRQDNTALNVVRHQDGRYTIELLNDTCHLRDGGSPPA